MNLSTHLNTEQLEQGNIAGLESQLQQNQNQEEPGRKYTKKFTATHKWCPCCERMLPHSAFGKGKLGETGTQSLSSYCLPCKAIHQRRYNDRQPGLAIWYDARNRASKKDMEFSITYEEFLLKDVDICPYLSIPIFWHPSKPRAVTGYIRKADSKSIDRIDSTKGYTIDNIIIVSWRANELKKDATYEELHTLATSLKTILTEHETLN